MATFAKLAPGSVSLHIGLDAPYPIEWDDPVDAIERCYELGRPDGLPVATPTVDRVRRFVEGAPSRRPGRRAATREVGPDDEASFLSLVAESEDILLIFTGGEKRTMCAVMPSWGPKVTSTPVVKAITVP